MTDETKTPPPSIDRNELMRLTKAVDKKKPDPNAVAELHRYLDAMPDLCIALGDTTIHLQNRLVDRLAPPPVQQIALRRRTVAVRDGLGGRGATQLEQLLIDHAVLGWLRLQDVEWDYSSAMERPLSPAQADFWDRHLAAAQRRFVRALETLARVRRLLTPTLQVNIAAEGGQQVNVSGDLHLRPPTGETAVE